MFDTKSISALILFFLVNSSSAKNNIKTKAEAVLKRNFDEWSRKHGRNYKTKLIEEQKFATWKQNDLYIQNHNNKIPTPTYTMAHNKFSDMTFDEFKAYYGLDKMMLLNEQHDHVHHDQNHENIVQDYTKSIYRDPTYEEDELLKVYRNLGLPDEVDWVEQGAVTSVKDQEDCGSCWAFSAAAVMEGLMFQSVGSIVDLSPQMLLDCDAENWGCDGGEKTTFDTIKEWGGLCAWEDYPYTARDGTCKKHNCEKVNGTRIGSIITGFGRDDTKANIALSPTWVAVYAGNAFQFYDEGIFSSDRCGYHEWTNHAVTAVGYGMDNETGKSYYRIKNSWGDDWGDEGYMYLDQESAMPRGTCGVTEEPTTISMYC